MDLFRFHQHFVLRKFDDVQFDPGTFKETFNRIFESYINHMYL